jgi:sugar lactone lactonase YvrE
MFSQSYWGSRIMIFRFLMITLAAAALIAVLFSCGEKITRPEEITFKSATVYVDKVVLWGFDADTQEYEQLLENGNMELWAESDSLGVGPPIGWSNETDGMTSNREDENVYSDSFSVRLTWTSTDDQVLLSDPLTVVEGDAYTCSLYVFDNDKGGRAQLCYYWGNGTVKNGGFSENSAAWQIMTMTENAPSEVTSLRIGIKLSDIIEGLSDTTYLQLNPPWDSDHGYSFSNPGKLIVGLDTYIYVCDTGNDRIVRLDAAGTVHSTYAVPHPIGITQDELLRLIVVNGTRDIYKIDTYPSRDGNWTISYSAESEDWGFLSENDVFVDVTCVPGGTSKIYFAAVKDTLLDQTGQVYLFSNDPDTNLTDNEDILAPEDFPVGGDDPNAPDTAHNPVVQYGTGVGYSDHPNGISAFTRNSKLYLLTTQDSSSFKTQVLEWYMNSYYHVAFFQPAILPGGGTDLYSDTLNLVPLAATADVSGNLFVVCKPDTLNKPYNLTISAYKFDPLGRLKEAWGPFGNATGEMNFPRGIAYDNFADRRTVYISDSGNNRILRFKLSTDIEN